MRHPSAPCFPYSDPPMYRSYTLLEIDDIELYLGCEVVDSTGVFGSMTIAQSMLPLPRPLRELATRDDLTAWLTRVLFNTSLPGRTKPPPCNIRLPHNLVAFFALILHVHRVGYPGHWLSDLLARVLSGRMVSDVVPYNAEYPIPVSCSSERVAPRPVRTDPWLIEFETIIATAYYAIPFPIAAALPADFSRDAEDIVVWQAAVMPATRFAQDEPSVFCSPFEPVTHLLFFRADEIRAGEVIRGMRDIFEGRSTPAPGTFFVLTVQEYVQYQTCVRFRLSRRRVERMRGEAGWSMVAYRSDNGIQGEWGPRHSLHATLLRLEGALSCQLLCRLRLRAGRRPRSTPRGLRRISMLPRIMSSMSQIVVGFAEGRLGGGSSPLSG